MSSLVLGAALVVPAVAFTASAAEARPLSTRLVFYGDASNVFVYSNPVALAENSARLAQGAYASRTGSSCVEVPLTKRVVLTRNPLLYAPYGGTGVELTFDCTRIVPDSDYVEVEWDYDGDEQIFLTVGSTTIQARPVDQIQIPADDTGTYRIAVRCTGDCEHHVLATVRVSDDGQRASSRRCCPARTTAGRRTRGAPGVGPGRAAPAGRGDGEAVDRPEEVHRDDRAHGGRVDGRPAADEPDDARPCRTRSTSC